MNILDRPREVEEAADVLVHYFKTVWPTAKLGRMTSDNETEIRCIAYNIYDAAIIYSALAGKE